MKKATVRTHFFHFFKTAAFQTAHLPFTEHGQTVLKPDATVHANGGIAVVERHRFCTRLIIVWMPSAYLLNTVWETLDLHGEQTYADGGISDRKAEAPDPLVGFVARS